MSERKSRLSKTGKSALDIFSPTVPPPQEAEARSEEPGHIPDPGPQDQEWSKVTVVLLNRQVVYLDRLTTSIRESTGSSVKRAEVIRALIDSLIQSGLERDLTQARSEQELRALLAARLVS